MDFPFLRTKEDFEKTELPVALAPTVEAIKWANHVVILYPLWLGSMPALLKAFLEQVFRPGVAFEYQPSGGMPRKLLTGKCSHRCHDGHAGVCLPLGFSRPQSQELKTQHSRVLRHQTGQYDPKYRRNDRAAAHELVGPRDARPGVNRGSDRLPESSPDNSSPSRPSRGVEDLLPIAPLIL